MRLSASASIRRWHGGSLATAVGNDDRTADADIGEVHADVAGDGGAEAYRRHRHLEGGVAGHVQRREEPGGCRKPNVNIALPAMTLTYCEPLTAYVIGPDATEGPRFVCQSKVPVRASSA